MIEKVEATFKTGLEEIFLIPSKRVDALYKDLWQIRSALKWSGKLKFSKREDGLEIHVFPSAYTVAKFVEVQIETEVKYHELTSGFAMGDIITELLKLEKAGTVAIKLSISHLTKTEQEKVIKVIEHLKFTHKEENMWTLIRKEDA